jgi:hypothetical protein
MIVGIGCRYSCSDLNTSAGTFFVVADMERIPAKDCRGGLRPPARACYGISRKAGAPGVVSPGSDGGRPQVAPTGL